MPTLEDRLKSLYLSIDFAEGAFVWLTDEAAAQIENARRDQWEKIVFDCENRYEGITLCEEDDYCPDVSAKFVRLGYEAATVANNNQIDDADGDAEEEAQPSEFLIVVMVEYYNLQGDSLVCTFGEHVIASQAAADSMQSEVHAHPLGIKGSSRVMDRFFGRDRSCRPTGSGKVEDEYGYLVSTYYNAVLSEKLDVGHAVIIPVSQILGINIGWSNADWTPPKFSK